ncbi:uncharacterized protein MELLADRAFT_109340 [Melampsora larici-populina 98AG31]|uniref:Uncharacterized protein n=1 Tax=Melampsora larici-populina (strain 98AG31 / pathotype 3-4-7) TaxID=747676 RepID=F4RW53_MELLP|nr:uncharacterized protein MELLADRAFT_109340 [Melampsora larici-populina 98AG31]EGG03220.1 hypothetical protein MELLADRAFT_109340 [Melampsora larici-populina 98AG31]
MRYGDQGRRATKIFEVGGRETGKSRMRARQLMSSPNYNPHNLKQIFMSLINIQPHNHSVQTSPPKHHQCLRKCNWPKIMQVYAACHAIFLASSRPPFSGCSAEAAIHHR